MMIVYVSKLSFGEMVPEVYVKQSCLERRPSLAPLFDKFFSVSSEGIFKKRFLMILIHSAIILHYVVD